MSFVRVTDEGPVRRITLARPDLHNAFDDVLIADLTAAFREAGAADSVRVVVLAGEGKSFCAGADLAWMGRMVAYSRDDNYADSLRLAGLFEAVDSCTKPVVARVHGAAIGGGVGLVACADIAIASSRAVFALSEVRLGLLPAVISPYVIGRIGVSSARRYFLTGERFGAGDALRVGLVSEVVDAAGGDEALDAAVARVVAALLRSGPEAVERCKQLIAAVPQLSVGERAAFTAGIIADLRVGAQGQEGMRAFLEKREPAWVVSEEA